MINTVIKSDGSVVPFDANKFNRKTRWAADRKVNWSDISFKTLRQLSDGCTTTDIDKAIIATCVEEFDEKHFMLAGRVLAGIIYKEAFGGFKNIIHVGVTFFWLPFFRELNGKKLFGSNDLYGSIFELVIQNKDFIILP